MSALELLFVRHGKSDANARGEYAGWTDSPLHPEGIEQMRGLCGRVALPLDAVYASPLQRARHSARLLAPGHQIEIIDALRETHFGLWEGMTAGRIQARYPEQWAAWQRDWLDCAPPGGESARESAARVLLGLDQILARHGHGRVLVVSHGGAIRFMLCRLLEQDIAHSWHYRIDPGGMARVELLDGYAVLRFLGSGVD